MKPKLVIGNWKMNTAFEEAEALMDDIFEALKEISLQTEVVVCPPFPYLELLADYTEQEGIRYSAGAQNCSQFSDGAFTGEISAAMLADLGVEYCIIGHSERRKYFHETSETILEKIKRLHENEIVPVVCCGEQIEDRNGNRHFEVIENQIKEALFSLPKEDFQSVIIAYEPVWAIGTGLTATPEQAEEMHHFIRTLIEKKYGQEVAYGSYILYGGSCNAQNALELFSQPNVDGGLIGGASLKATDFCEIIFAAETTMKEN